jgi:hypothetical protein
MIAMPTPGSAQTAATAVTFTVSLNLTQLPPDLERVRLICFIKPSAVLLYPAGMGQALTPTSETFPYKSELWVAAGQVVGTMSVVYPIFAEWLKDPIGKTADYECWLQGFSTSLKRWDFFSESPSAPVFLLKPAPPLQQGTFVW